MRPQTKEWSLFKATSKISAEHCISNEATVEESPTSKSVSSRVIFSVLLPLSILYATNKHVLKMETIILMQPMFYRLFKRTALNL